MPRKATENRFRRSAPYTPTSPTAMSTQFFLPLITPTSAEWPISYDHMQSSMIPVQQIVSPMVSACHQQQRPSLYLAPQQYATRQEPPPTPSLLNPVGGPWSAEDDQVLQKARCKNLSWGAIQQQYFAGKTSNACRKRHERLMLKKRGNEWDDERMAKLAVAYKEKREETWSPLAEHLGERWEHVEKACMEKGLKSILTLANSHSRGKMNRYSKSTSGNGSDGFLREREREEREDSGVAFAGESSSRRSSRSTTGTTSGRLYQLL